MNKFNMGDEHIQARHGKQKLWEQAKESRYLFTMNLGRHAKLYGSDWLPELIEEFQQTYPGENEVALKNALFFYHVYHGKIPMPDAHEWVHKNGRKEIHEKDSIRQKRRQRMVAPPQT